MNFSCDNCQRRYSIADDKVRGKTVRIRCKNCQNVITLTGPAFEPEPEPEIFEEDRTRMVPLTEIEKIRASSLVEMPAVATPPAPPKDPWEDEPTRTAPPVDTAAQWFAMVKGQQVGPLDATGLSERMATGEISVRTYLWKQGMDDWKRAADLPELATLLAGARPTSPPPVAEPPAQRAAPRTWKEPEPQAREPDRSQFDEPLQPEPQQDPEPAPEVDAAPERDTSAFGEPLGNEPKTVETRPAASSVGAADLFSDLDLEHRGQEATGQVPLDETTSPGVAKPRSGKKDPFAALGEIDPSKLPPPSETTNTFIARSGVNRRNPPWKIATFVILLIALPVGVLYLLSELKVVPLEVTRVDSTGKQVKESVFSAEGVSGLRDMLLGRKPEPVKAAPQPERPRQAAQPRPDKPASTTKPAGGPSSEELKELYSGNPDKHEVAPTVRKDEDVAAKDSSSDGPDQKEVAKVLSQNQTAFQNCIELTLKKNPNFKGGKINITATVGSSGAVKKVAIDRREIDGSSLGECLKTRARRMVFPAFAGDDVDVEIPLILGKSL